MVVSTPKRARVKSGAYAAPALEKGLDILELLAGEPGGLTQTQIADRLGRSHPEIFRMLLCLQRRGYLRRVSPGETFELSAKLFALSHRHPPTKSLLDSALPLMRALAAATAQSCHLATIFERQVLILASVESPQPRNFSVRVGARFPIADTASGAVLMAWTDSQTIDSLSQTRSTVGWLARLERVRRRGYEEQRSPSVRGVIDMSFPVRDGHGDVVAAFTMPYLATRNDRAGQPKRAHTLTDDAARRLSVLLGCSTDVAK